MGVDFRSGWRYADGAARIDTVRLINGLYDCTCREFVARDMCQHIATVAEQGLWIENETIVERSLREIREQYMLIHDPIHRANLVEARRVDEDEFIRRNYNYVRAQWMILESLDGRLYRGPKTLSVDAEQRSLVQMRAS